jgi:hypothetical protein
MLSQIIDLSIDYFSYPFSIKIDINYDEKKTLPSITFCTKRDIFFSKTQIKDNYPDIYVKIVKLKRDYDFCSPKYESLNKKKKILINAKKILKNLKKTLVLYSKRLDIEIGLTHL